MSESISFALIEIAINKFREIFIVYMIFTQFICLEHPNGMQNRTEYDRAEFMNAPSNVSSEEIIEQRSAT